MRKKIAALFLLAIVVHGFPEEGKKSYKDYVLVRTDPIQDEQTAHKLMELGEASDIDMWSHPTTLNGTADFLVSPDRREYVEKIFQDLNIGHSVLISDVGTLIEEQEFENTKNLRASVSRIQWNAYHQYDGVIAFCRNLQNRHRDGTTVTYTSIGKSTEGRDIPMVKISSGGTNKPAIWIDGGMHAREHISPATVMYIMEKLANDNSNKDLVDTFDWYIVPVINVDGYQYTFDRDRMWRKTRSKKGQNRWCVGVDPNRNWDFHWSESGSSRDPCSDVYHGPKAFSEPETFAVSQKIMQLRSQLKMYLTFHSYSQLWLVPWSYAKVKPADFEELSRVARIGAKAIEATYGTRYRVGAAPDILYSAAGGSDDWAKGAAGIKYSYTLELRDTGRHGFLLPAAQIVASGTETFNGVAAITRDLRNTLRLHG